MQIGSRFVLPNVMFRNTSLSPPTIRISEVLNISVFILPRTILTGVHRYHYVDTNYALTKEEEEQRQRHRQVYTDYVKQLRQTRLQKIKER